MRPAMAKSVGEERHVDEDSSGVFSRDQEFSSEISSHGSPMDGGNREGSVRGWIRVYNNSLRYSVPTLYIHIRDNVMVILEPMWWYNMFGWELLAFMYDSDDFIVDLYVSLSCTQVQLNFSIYKNMHVCELIRAIHFFVYG